MARRRNGQPRAATLSAALLLLALLIALAFEFVNGFHDTATRWRPSSTTNSLPAHFAVVWSGFWNFFGVLVSSGAVAFGIISLLPVGLILNVGSGAGMAMVFALLIAAIIWNLGTWYLGSPPHPPYAHRSIIGVGIANQLIQGQSGTSGVDWGQAAKVAIRSCSPGGRLFFAAGLLLLTMKVLVKNRRSSRAQRPTRRRRGGSVGSWC